MTDASTDTADFTVQVVRDTEQLIGLRPDWNRLAGAIPFRQWEWLATWWEQFQQPDWQLHVVILRDRQSQICGIAPWFLENRVGQGRVLRFLGSGKACTDELTILACETRQSAIAECFVDWLGSSADPQPGRAGCSAPTWDLLELEGVGEDAMMRKFVACMTQRGNAATIKELECCWQIRVPDSWDQYVDGLQKRYRQKVRGIARNFLDSGRARLTLADDSEHRGAFLQQLESLHQRRRASLGDEGCFASPQFSRLIAEVAERFGQRSQLQLAQVTLDGRVAAMGFGLLSATTMYLYQTGVDPDLMTHQPGWILHTLLIRECQRRGLAAYDLMRGNEPYKAHLGASPTRCYRIRLVPDRAVAQLRHQVWEASAQFRSWLQMGRVGSTHE